MSDAFTLIQGLSPTDSDAVQRINAGLEIVALITIPIIIFLFLWRYGRKTILDYTLMYICAVDTVFLPYVFSRFSPSMFSKPASFSPPFSCSIASESVQYAALLGSSAAVTSTAIMRLQIFMHPQSDSFGAARRRFSDRASPPGSRASSQLQANLHRRTMGFIAGALHISKNVLLGALLPALYGVVSVAESKTLFVSSINNTVIGDYGNDRKRRDIIGLQGGVAIYGFSDIASNNASVTTVLPFAAKACKLASAPENLLLAIWFFEIITQTMIVSWFLANYTMKWVHRHSTGAEMVLYNPDPATKRGSGDSASQMIVEDSTDTQKQSLYMKAHTTFSSLNLSAKSESILNSMMASAHSMPFSIEGGNVPPVPVLSYGLGTPTTQVQPTVSFGNSLSDQASSMVPANASMHRPSQRNSISQPKRNSTENGFTALPQTHGVVVPRPSILRTQPQRGSIFKASGALAASTAHQQKLQQYQQQPQQPGATVIGGGIQSLGTPINHVMCRSSTSILSSTDEVRMNPTMANPLMAQYRMSGGAVPSGAFPGPVPSISTPPTVSRQDAIRANIVNAAAVAHRRTSLETHEYNHHAPLAGATHLQPQLPHHASQPIDMIPPQAVASAPHKRSFASAQFMRGFNPAASYASNRSRAHSVTTSTPTTAAAVHSRPGANAASLEHDSSMRSQAPAAAGLPEQRHSLRVSEVVEVATMQHARRARKDITYSDMESLLWVIFAVVLNSLTWLPWTLAKMEKHSSGTVAVPLVAGVLAPVREFVIFAVVLFRHRGTRVIMGWRVPWKDLVAEVAMHGTMKQKGIDNESNQNLKGFKSQ
ncbi:hypothetical protein BC830DRAFT_1129901 [Chytriomyces sp. MP71]|nr:hypothetical protein BC830DRAFT_1129901 [Chytriomyces sp. MP71]